MNVLLFRIITINGIKSISSDTLSVIKDTMSLPPSPPRAMAATLTQLIYYEIFFSNEKSNRYPNSTFISSCYHI